MHLKIQKKKRSSRGRPKTTLEKAITKTHYKKTTLRRRLELLDQEHSLSASRINGKGAHLDISSWNVCSLRIRRKNISSQKEQVTYKRMSMRLAVGTDKNVGSEARLPGLISWCDLVKYLTSLCFPTPCTEPGPASPVTRQGLAESKIETLPPPPPHSNCGNFLKRWEYQTTLPASWEICMQVKKQLLELDM